MTYLGGDWNVRASHPIDPDGHSQQKKPALHIFDR